MNSNTQDFLMYMSYLAIVIAILTIYYMMHYAVQGTMAKNTGYMKTAFMYYGYSLACAIATLAFITFAIMYI